MWQVSKWMAEQRHSMRRGRCWQVFQHLLYVCAIVFLFTTLLLLSCDNDGNEEHLSFARLQTEGLRSDLVPSQELVICDQESLDEFWASYGTNTETDLDFGLYVIVGVFLGEKPNPGYGVEITDMVRLKDSVHVTYTEYLPDPTADYPAVLTYPYDMVYFESDSCEITFSSVEKQL